MPVFLNRPIFLDRNGPRGVQPVRRTAVWFATLALLVGCEAAPAGNGFFFADVDWDALDVSGLDTAVDATPTDAVLTDVALSDVKLDGDGGGLWDVLPDGAVTDAGPGDTGPADTGKDAGPLDAGDSSGSDSVSPDGTSGCANAGQCDDGDSCTTDTCTAGKCGHTPVPGCGGLGQPCDKDNPCKQGVCQLSSRVCVPCLQTSDCDPGQACVAQQCKPAITCKSDVDCKATSQVCNKGEAICVECLQDGDCGAGKACLASQCVVDTPCASSKDCPAVCDLGQNKCVDCLSNDDCGAGTFCNAAQQCQAQVCKSAGCGSGGSFFLCSPGGSGYAVGVDCSDDNACTQNACSADKGCVLTQVTGVCNDGDACTSGDTCKGTTCAGTAIVCQDNNPCTSDSCKPASGCSYTNTSGSCTDNSVCTEQDFCSTGKCQPGSKKDCDDGNPCTTDSCDATKGCSSVNNTTSCDDGDACTTADSCSGGACAGKTSACDDNNDCTTDNCNPQTGACTSEQIIWGGTCDDGDPCTTGDFCQFGFCSYTGEKNCDDANPCTSDYCGGGVCQNNPNSATCNDGDPCTTGDYCAASVCNKGQGIANCNDGNSCTDDSCKTKVGCTFTANTLACNDSNACTDNDTCGSTTCKGTTKVCSDGDGCTTDTCSTATGCKYAADTAKCDDKNPCTADSCTSPSGTCVNKAIAGCCLNSSECNDGKACTTDYCADNKCLALDTPNCCAADQDCDDDKPCTTDKCDAGSCKHTDLPWDPTPTFASNWDTDTSLDSWGSTTSTNSGYSFAYSTAVAKTGTGSLRFGPTNTLAMVNLKTSYSGTILSPSVVLPTGKVELKLWVMSDIQTLSSSNVNRQITVDILLSGGKTMTLGSAFSAVATWKEVTWDLTPVAGQTVQIRIKADAGGTTTYAANGSGMYVDGVRIRAACSSKTCQDNLDCVSGAGCAKGTCSEFGQCSYVYACCSSAADCNDGLTCSADSCNPTSGQCSNTVAGCECLAGSDCDDGDSCTLDTCNSANKCVYSDIGGCCKGNSDCFDGISCTTDVCGSGGQCVFTNTCCSKAEDCNDGDAKCTTDTCDNGTCKFTPTGAEGCCSPIVLSETFDAASLSGWTLTNSSGVTQGWQLWSTAFTSHSGTGALYYGSTTLGNFDFGFTGSNGIAKSQAFLVPTATAVTAETWVYMDTESGTNYDNLTLQVVRPGKTTVNKVVKSQAGFALLKWVKITVDLTPYAGESVQLAWSFDTVDGASNTGKGVFVDDVVVTRTCP